MGLPGNREQLSVTSTVRRLMPDAHRATDRRAPLSNLTQTWEAVAREPSPEHPMLPARKGHPAPRVTGRQPHPVSEPGFLVHKPGQEQLDGALHGGHGAGLWASKHCGESPCWRFCSRSSGVSSQPPSKVRTAFALQRLITNECHGPSPSIRPHQGRCSED